MKIEIWKNPVLIGYEHFNKSGMQQDKPKLGFAWVAMPGGSFGLIPSKEIDNWDELPDKIIPFCPNRPETTHP